MKDHVEIDHLTKYDDFRVNRDQVMDLEIWLKIYTSISNQFFIGFVTTVKSGHAPTI